MSFIQKQTCAMRHIQRRVYCIWMMVVLTFFLHQENVTASDLEENPMAPPGVTKDYCSGSVFQADCGDHGVVVMESAVYGRKRAASQCVEGRQLCSANVHHVMEELCSGRHRCKVVIPDTRLDDVVPCDRQLRFYLEASYSCVAAQVPRQSQCRSPTQIPVYSHQVNITSITTDETGCGSGTAPYILEAQQGQTLNITLLDFGSEHNNGRTCGGDFQYGSLVDSSAKGHQMAVCGGRERVRLVYSSVGSTIQLKLHQKKDRKLHFIIGVTAIGCPDIIPQKHAWVRRDAKGAVIGCHETRQTWHLECDGHRWKGVIGNCTRYLEAAKMAANKLKTDPSLPHGVAILIIIGIAFFLSLIIIGIGLIFLRWYKQKNKNLNYNYDFRHDRQIYEEPKYKMHQPVQEPSTPKPSSGGAGRKNEYTHIWEHPLPEPCLAHGNNPATPAASGGGGYGMPAAPPCDVPAQQGPDHQYGGSLDSKTNKDSLSRYYALDRDSQLDGKVFTTSLVT